MTESAYVQLLASLPLAVRTAIETVDLDAFQCAMDDLPADQAESIARQLAAAGIIGVGPASEAEYQAMLQEFDRLIQAIVSVGRGDESQRDQVLAVLPRLESAGYHLSGVIPNIWAGERRGDILTAGLDPNSARLVNHILSLLGNSPAEDDVALPGMDLDATAASIPPAVLAAIEAQDETAFRQAMQALPVAERQYVAGQLARLQAQADADAEAWLAALPTNIRVAVLDQDPQQLQTALQALPPWRAQEILEQLEAAGVLQEIEDNQSEQILVDFEPLILAVVGVARGNQAARPQVEALLLDLKLQGWQLYEPIQNIWAGERSFPILNAELDQQDGIEHAWLQPYNRQIIQRILEEIDSPG